MCKVCDEKDIIQNYTGLHKNKILMKSEGGLTKPVTLLLALIFSFSGVYRAQAGIVYSNFGPGDSYNSSAPYAVGGSSPHSLQHQSVAASFVPGTDYTLDSIEVAAVDAFPSYNLYPLYLDIMTDVAGQPGVSIEQLEVYTSFPSTVLLLNSNSHPLLTGGTQYWLVGSTKSNTLHGWNQNSISDLGVAFDQGSGWSFESSSQSPAFRINGTVIPAPSSLVLVTMGLSVLISKRRKRITA